MSISSAINAARSGLETTSLRADIVATNVANASTEGYVRRAVSLNENVLGGRSSGVLADGISRNRNEATTAQRRTTSTDVSHAQVLADQRIRMSQAFGDTAQGGGLVSRTAALEDAIKLAAVSPESEATLNGLLRSAKAMTTEFESLSDLSGKLRNELNNNIDGAIGIINQNLKSIESLNAKIAGIDRTSNGAAALMDQRDRVLDTLSEYLAIKIAPREGGQIDVLTREGVYLLNGEARQIEAQRDPDATSLRITNLQVDGIDITPGNQSYAALSTGHLAAVFAVRDNELPAFSDKMNSIGRDLADRFASQQVDPTLGSNQPGLFVFTTATDQSNGIGKLTLNAAVDPELGGRITRLRDGIGSSMEGPEGSAAVLQGMANAMSTSRTIDSDGLRGRFTSFELVSHTASLLGQARISQSTTLSASQAELTALIETEQSQTGVNIDDQMQELLLIEQAYAANARVIQAADEMLQRLIEL